jgi:phenylacetate-CoA ligase
MRLDFSKVPLKNRAFSEKPMTFIDQAPKNLLGAIIDLVAIETGNRAAREHWQQMQFRNLLTHATQRSAFWRSRTAGRRLSGIEPASLPRLTRENLRNQVASEGPLLTAADGIPTEMHATSGSSGIPVRFFISEFNSRYNVIRSLAQFFLEGLDLSLNRTREIGRAHV